MSNTTSDPCQILPWDSQFFGWICARVLGSRLNAVRAKQINTWCQQQAVRCLYFFADSADDLTVSLAEEHGYHLVDVRLTMERSCAGITTPSTGNTSDDDGSHGSRVATIRPATEMDLPVLMELAGTSHKDTRFFYDRHIPAGKSIDLYRTWIEKSVRGWAQLVLVADAGSAANGYVTGHLPKEQDAGSIGLIAVAAGARGRGLGGRLVDGAVANLAARGARRVSVVTQARNLAAQRLYLRCGFLTCALQLCYHKWFDRTEAR